MINLVKRVEAQKMLGEAIDVSFKEANRIMEKMHSSFKGLYCINKGECTHE